MAKAKKQKGIINGVVFGASYILVMYLISSILLKDFSLNFKSLIMIFAGMIAGIFGGIIGVNL